MEWADGRGEGVKEGKLIYWKVRMEEVRRWWMERG